MARPVDEGRRQALLDAATDYVIENGLASSSLRDIADALGVRAPTLLHHFGSREALVSEVLNEVRDRLRQIAAAALAADNASLDVVWNWASSPDREEFYRTFFEIYGTALRQPDDYRPFLDHVVSDWVGSPGSTTEVARRTLMVALTRGLLLDLLTTGDTARVNEAFRVAAAWLTEAEPGGRH